MANPNSQDEETPSWGSVFAYGLMIVLGALALVPVVAPLRAWLQLP